MGERTQPDVIGTLSEAGMELKRSMDIKFAKKSADQSLALTVFNQKLGPAYAGVSEALIGGYDALETAKTPSVEVSIQSAPGQQKDQLGWLAAQVSNNEHVSVSLKEDGLKRSFVLTYKR